MPMSSGSLPTDGREHQRHIIGLTRLLISYQSVADLSIKLEKFQQDTTGVVFHSINEL